MLRGLEQVSRMLFGVGPSIAFGDKPVSPCEEGNLRDPPKAGCLHLASFHPTELQLRRQLSFSEDSDLSSDDILERSSQKSKREVGGPSP